ncbi:hypothetical protein DE48_20360 [Salmonella enterica subsp. enterica serovar Schwarzengrund]|nr:hypothetical protein DE48_20360 [Salmonella enterica subsp. enterica serovar Schwarzengrund]
MRFIPAGAGNTVESRKTLFVSAVYPRWRGEHGFGYLSGVRRRGLSPLARGILTLDEASSFPGRFIPAGAGNTS